MKRMQDNGPINTAQNLVGFRFLIENILKDLF